MKNVPVLFISLMIQAIMEGRKNQTRRMLKPQPQEGYTPKILVGPFDDYFVEVRKSAVLVDTKTRTMKYGQRGDILWVRETLYQNGELGLEYAADKKDIDEDIIPLDFNVRVDKKGHYKFCKIPSIYMQKWACRIFLKVKSVRLERLHDISEADALAEGVIKDVQIPVADFKTEILYRDYTGKTAGCADARSSFMTLWISINGKESWDANPWVWVVDFYTTAKPENF